MTSIRIVSADYYMCPPIQGLDVMYSEFRGTSVNHVPIIRIFGSLTTGKKICLHVHGVFPYIYIPYDGSETADSIMYQIATAIDKSLNVLLGQSSSNTQHIYKIALVSGRPLYGYHTKEHQFLKLYFYNPLMIKKVNNILENGSIMGKVFQPHEAHLPYILQFMIDYNLHGMSFIKLSEIRFRFSPNNQVNEIKPELYLPHNISKISVCELEGDVLAEHILNGLEVKQGELGSNPGIMALWEDEKQRRRNHNLESQISECLSQAERDCSTTASDLMFKQVLTERLMNLPKTVKESPENISVYPAETPESEDILNASAVDSHLSQSSMNVSSVDDTILNNECENLLDLLCEIAEKEIIEEGSVLSQTVRYSEESDDEKVEADLSLPLSPIPQLDGNVDYDVCLKKNKSIKQRGLDMPVLENVDYTRELFIPHGKFKLKRLSPLKKPAATTLKKQFKFVKKQLRRYDLLKLIIEIKKNCILRRIESSQNIIFRTVPSTAHSQTPKNTATIIIPTLGNSFNITISPNRNQFTYEEISNSSLFPLLQKELGQLTVIENKKFLQKAKKDLLTNINLSYFTTNCCNRPNCSVLKRELGRIINDCQEINLKNIKEHFKDFCCCVPNLFKMGPSEERKVVKRSNFPQKKIKNSTLTENLSTERFGCCGNALEKKHIATNSNSICCNKNEQTEIQNSFSSNQRSKNVVLDKNNDFCFGSNLLCMESVEERKVTKIPNFPQKKSKNLSLTENLFTERFDFTKNATIKDQIVNKSNFICCNKNQQTEIQNSLSIYQHSKEVVLDENHNIQIENKPSEQLQFPGKAIELQKKMYLQKRRYMKIYRKVAVKQFQGLDGANDSSSSSEDECQFKFTHKKRRRVYSPLFMDESIENRSCDFMKEYASNSSKNKTKSTVDGSKLELDRTLIEEDLVCSYTLRKGKKLPLQDKGTVKFDEKLSKKKLNKSFAIKHISQEAGPSYSSTSYSKNKSLENNLNFFKQSIQHITTFDGCYIWKPKHDPPTRIEVAESLKQFGIPEVRHEQPFYSNPQDAKGRIEIGNAILKVSSKTSIDYPNFESAFNILNPIKSTIATNNVAIITPIKEPPTRREVENWIKVNVEEKKEEITVKTMKMRTKLPVSQNDQELSDDYISISPCSPLIEDKANIEGKSEEVVVKSIKIKLKPPVRQDDEEISDDSITISSCSPQNENKSKYSGSPVLNKNRKALKLQRKKNEVKSPETLRKTVIETQFLANATNDCQVSAATFNNTSLENLQDVLAVSEHQHLLTFIMELHVQTRGDFKPDPQLDLIRAIFYGIIHDSSESTLNNTFGVFTVKSTIPIFEDSYRIVYVDSEIDLINRFVNFLNECDPDIMCGFEIEMASWGYLIERGYAVGLNLPPLLSRIHNKKMKFEKGQDLPGRIVLDMWRLLRHEIALQSYSFENVVYHILHKRVPLFDFKQLSFWWEHKSCLYKYKVLDFFFLRIKFIILLIEKLDLIGRTSELARLFGIQFYEVLSRGSQFRVESMMLRLAKPQNYIAVTPSVSQRAKMRAPEFLPLILEPESKFYADPVIVLDFQSLYPSMIIAYNYCFSTCLGRVEHLGKNTPFEFGATNLKIPPKYLKKLLNENKITFSPCGVAFVGRDVRKGILPKMLEEILNTRLMVKKSMKQNKNNKTLQRVLHSRQLGLKLIANVTYGYTAANFSGRMPCVEIGDSVVSKGRETLQRAINLVDTTSEWGAKVIYGDTDSLFVLLPGKTRKDAFKIGAQIAETVTNANPAPIKLKLEKVYQPCILQTKKRYVGYIYESSDQITPQFDAKGIETVRRDGCPAAAKMLEKSLKMLFDHCNVSLIKQYVLRQFNKILMGRISIQELTFAKEYRGTSGYRPGACVPALELARKWMMVDKRHEPRTGERVPYIIVNGPPGLPLIRLVRSPYDLLSDTSLRPNAFYYITRVIIPPINRCFNLIGVDLSSWFDEMPRKQYQYLPKSSPTKKATISQFFMTTSCAVCGQQSQNGVCDNCISQSQTAVSIMFEKVRVWEQHSNEINLICKSCTGNDLAEACISLDCPVLYQRHQANVDLQQSDFVRQIIQDNF